MARKYIPNIIAPVHNNVSKWSKWPLSLLIITSHRFDMLSMQFFAHERHIWWHWRVNCFIVKTRFTRRFSFATSHILSIELALDDRDVHSNDETQFYCFHSRRRLWSFSFDHYPLEVFNPCIRITDLFRII